MPAGSQRIVKVLGALLRIADGLDRSQFSVVQTVDVTLGKKVTMTLHVSGDAELEVWAARGRSDLFETVFQRPVQFEVIPTGGRCIVSDSVPALTSPIPIPASSSLSRGSTAQEKAPNCFSYRNGLNRENTRCFLPNGIPPNSFVIRPRRERRIRA